MLCKVKHVHIVKMHMLCSNRACLPLGLTAAKNMLHALQDLTGYEMPKRRLLSRKSPYIAVKMKSERSEHIVEKALEARNIRGGCWDTIMGGKLPVSGLSAQGFRTAPM